MPVLTTVINNDELAVRLFEAMEGLKRPAGYSTEEAILKISAEAPFLISRLRLGAIAAAEYIAECMNESGQNVTVRKVDLVSEIPQ